MSESIPTNKDTIIAQEIREMYKQDQEMRKRALSNEGIIESNEDDTLDRRNTERMKEIVDKIGWPTISRFGEEISNAAWLLVQHADQDVEFQKRCLDLIKDLPQGEVSKRNLAYLEDRARVNEGRPQLYGTQFGGEGDAYGPKPIEDPDHVDERRAALGMESLADYRNELLRVYRIKTSHED